MEEPEEICKMYWGKSVVRHDWYDSGHVWYDMTSGWQWLTAVDVKDGAHISSDQFVHHSALEENRLCPHLSWQIFNQFSKVFSKEAPQCQGTVDSSASLSSLPRWSLSCLCLPAVQSLHVLFL